MISPRDGNGYINTNNQRMLGCLALLESPYLLDKCMFVINTDIWQVYDPDEIIGLMIEDVASEWLHYPDYIYPREDLFQCTHRTSGIIIDFGCYNNDEAINGYWIVNVIDPKLAEPWENKKEHYLFLNCEFIDAITCLSKMITKYA